MGNARELQGQFANAVPSTRHQNQKQKKIMGERLLQGLACPSSAFPQLLCVLWTA